LIKYFKNLEKMLSLKDKAYQVIKLEIIVGNLKPGLFLTEEKLSESMHISRGPIREALNRLEKKKILLLLFRVEGPRFLILLLKK
jgi:DNA-binding GntR family transcriptional regulator